jgi:ApaG protein
VLNDALIQQGIAGAAVHIFGGEAAEHPAVKSLFLPKASEMVSKISEGVEVSVETFYQADYSNPLNHEYMFAYRITIENHNAFTIQLLRRHWYIFDSNGEHREVEGEGVVGVQPVLKPGENYQYVSGCNLRTEMGRMYGHYQMQNENSKQLFSVNIPAFDMVVPNKLN